AADGKRLDAEEGAVDATVGDQVVRDGFCGVDGNGEADARGRTARREDGGVDADDFAVRIDERAAGIAAIDGSVGLNGFIDEGGLAGLHGAAEGTDDASGQRALEAEGIADSENLLADLQSARIPEREHSEFFAFGVNLDEGDVVALVGADGFGR